MDARTRTAAAAETALPRYETPEIRVLSESEVLTAFQMTSAQISAASCWWTVGDWNAP